jgi:hypothetical protein
MRKTRSSSSVGRTRSACSSPQRRSRHQHAELGAQTPNVVARTPGDPKFQHPDQGVAEKVLRKWPTCSGLATWGWKKRRPRAGSGNGFDSQPLVGGHPGQFREENESLTSE